MLSRHSIRIKVLQSLYAKNRDEQLPTAEVEKLFLRMIHESYRLFLYSMHILEALGDFNLQDWQIKQNKLVPTEQDRLAGTWLYDNPLIKGLRESDDWQALVKKEGLKSYIDTDKIRQWYKSFVQTDYYKDYISKAEQPLSEHQYALVNLYKYLQGLEVYVDHMEDFFPNFEEDESLVYATVKRSLRSLPKETAFYELAEVSSELSDDFGLELIQNYLSEEKKLLDLIVPKLQNWKEDRVAIVDMVLIKMALCEFLYFPKIPTRVSLDEYLNLARDYSTDKSKRFVNGILDRLMKELQASGQIVKEETDLSE